MEGGEGRDDDITRTTRTNSEDTGTRCDKTGGGEEKQDTRANWAEQILEPFLRMKRYQECQKVPRNEEHFLVPLQFLRHVGQDFTCVVQEMQIGTKKYQEIKGTKIGDNTGGGAKST